MAYDTTNNYSQFCRTKPQSYRFILCYNSVNKNLFVSYITTKVIRLTTALILPLAKIHQSLQSHHRHRVNTPCYLGETGSLCTCCSTVGWSTHPTPPQTCSYSRSSRQAWGVMSLNPPGHERQQTVLSASHQPWPCDALIDRVPDATIILTMSTATWRFSVIARFGRRSVSSFSGP